MVSSDNKCICEILLLRNQHNISVHLSWCPKSFEYKQYLKLPWWKKLFTTNPINNGPHRNP